MNRFVLVALALAACKGDAKEAKPATGSGNVARSGAPFDGPSAAETLAPKDDPSAPGFPEAGIADAAGSGSAGSGSATGSVTVPTAAAGASPIPIDTTQLIIGVIDDWDDTTVDLKRFQRTQGSWVTDGEPWTGVIGAGAAWGAGLHGNGPVAGRKGPVKAEGDGRSPAGAFSLVASYGYGKTGPGTDANLPYTTATSKLECVDDPASAHYNQIVEATAQKDWKSSEDMKRSDELYEYVVEVGHNPAHTPKLGSCIFLHVWRDAESPTVGCTAMPAATLRGLLSWLTRDARPVYVLLPTDEYAALAPAWGLPQ